MLNQKRRMLSTLVALGLVLGAGATALAPDALACGGFFCARVPVDQAGERILFVQNGDEVIAHVQVQYQGAAEKFSWVVPTPSQPTLGIGSDALFTQLRNATRPQFNLTLDTKGDCPQPVFAAQPGSVAENAGGLADSRVTVVQRAEVGPYDSVVLQSNDPAALKTWLRENDYDVPAKLDPLLDPYVTGKYYFVALKLLKDRSTGDLQPIVLKYKSTKPGVPIRLTGIAATADMDVYVWVLGKHRAIPENYRHAQINEARIDWLNSGTNYRQVVTEAMNEAGGQAFVTDYAGESKVVPTDAFTGAGFNTAAIATLTDPVAFTKAVVTGGYFDSPLNGRIAPGIDEEVNGFIPVSTQQTINFLKRYVPKPAKHEQIDDFSFYQYLGNYKADLAAVDGAKAAAELEQTVVQPYKEIREMFAQHPYLTQLYTTMSPDEMTQDPTFLFNPDLPKVANVHTATGVRDCTATRDFFSAPIKITLSNGVSFMAASQNLAPGTPGQPVAMPAALRIEQLKSTGAASLIQDNQGTIAKALGAVEARGEAIAVTTGGGAATAGSAGTSSTVSVPRTPRNKAPINSGFGCACAPSNQPAVPLKQGAGEGLTYALAFLGFLGYRRWLGR